jgi:chromate transporter
VSPLIDLFAVFLRLSLLAFGGGLGILPEMERQAVTLHGWVTQREFLDAWALSQVTPGPGMLMVVVVGLRAAGLPGAVAAGLAMFGPAALLCALVADRWTRWATGPALGVLRRTLAPVALGLLLAGCLTLGRLSIDGPGTAVLAVLGLLACGFTRLSPAVVVLAGAAAGLLWLR